MAGSPHRSTAGGGRNDRRSSAGSVAFRRARAALAAIAFPAGISQVTLYRRAARRRGLHVSRWSRISDRSLSRADEKRYCGLGRGHGRAIRAGRNPDGMVAQDSRPIFHASELVRGISFSRCCHCHHRISNAGAHHLRTRPDRHLVRRAHAFGRSNRRRGSVVRAGDRAGKFRRRRGGRRDRDRRRNHLRLGCAPDRPAAAGKARGRGRARWQDEQLDARVLSSCF